MKKCYHAKDKRDHCWVVGCENNRLEHWPYKSGAKRIGTFKPHDVNPIHAVHKAATKKEES